MINKESRNSQRKIRHKRCRKKIFGDTNQPRLTVFRSLKNIYAQIIDDEKGHTIVSASTLEKEIFPPAEKKSTKETAAKVGELVAERALAKNVKRVVFDRSGYKYHGRVAAVADGARKKGLEF